MSKRGRGRSGKLDDCPCGSTEPYAGCCEPLLEGVVTADSAERLMRSRYTAYVRGRVDYLLQTWHPSTRPPTLALDTNTNWLGLRVLGTVEGRPGDRSGTVEFVARCKTHGRAQRLHELSTFTHELGRWYYLAARVSEGPVPG